MSRRTAREVIFVCIAINKNELITKMVVSDTTENASKIFSEEFLIPPQEILGPFYKKKKQVLETTRSLKFSNQTKKAIYNDWIVNAFILKEPENQAYLVFLKRVDDKKSTFPKGTITVPISDLRFI